MFQEGGGWQQRHETQDGEKRMIHEGEHANFNDQVGAIVDKREGLDLVIQNTPQILWAVEDAGFPRTREECELVAEKHGVGAEMIGAISLLASIGEINIPTRH